MTIADSMEAVDTSNKYFFGALSVCKGIGSKTLIELLNHFSWNIAKLKNFETENHKFIKYRLQINSAIENTDKYVMLLKRYDIGFKCIWENDYPVLLKELFNPPAVIYYKGSWKKDIFENSIAIVGSRKCSEYGKMSINKIIKEVASIHPTITSGLAIGADTFAHQYALENNLPTIAVLAAGCHEASPKSNQKLFDKIISNNGLILSEFLPGIVLTPGLFTVRNRIIAGISKCTIVSEASIKSGALITARHAFENNRDVFAIPGKINSPLSEGTNYLIKNNYARLIDRGDDIFKEVSYNNYNSYSSLSFEEKKVVDYFSGEASSIDNLAAILNKNVASVIDMCTTLEIKGFIKKGYDGNYNLVV